MTASQRRSAAVLLLLMFIGVFLETLGVGLIIPASTLLIQGDVAERYPLLAGASDLFEGSSREQLVISGMLVLLAVYLFKAAYLGFLAWRQARFAFCLQAAVSERLFRGYLTQPYAFHLSRNSATLLNNSLSEVKLVATATEQALLLGTETLVLGGIVLLLIMLESVSTVVIVAALGVAGWGFHRVTRGRILDWGRARQNHEAMRAQHLQQGLGGVKDVKLLGREDYFLSQYAEHNDGSARVGARQAALNAFPRLFLELLAVTGFVALVLSMIAQRESLSAVVPTLAFFAAAAFRAMPAVNRIVTALQVIRYATPVLQTLSTEVERSLGSTREPFGGPILTFDRSLVIEHVTFTYESAERPSLKDVDLTISPGSCVGFLGTSGAGKSTLIDVMLGLLSPESGRVLADNVDIRTNVRCWQSRIGYVPQVIYLTDNTLRRNVAFGIRDSEIDDGAVWRALSAAQLDGFVKSLPLGLDTMLGERGVRLSGGQRQRIGIARALYKEPPILVLDEATSSLDVNTEAAVMDAVGELRGRKTILIVTHRHSTLRYCDVLYGVENGSLVRIGSYSDLARDEEQPRPPVSASAV